MDKPLFNDDSNATLLIWIKYGVGVIVSALAGVIVFLFKVANTRVAEEIAETKKERDEARELAQKLAEENKRLAVENGMLKAKYGEDIA
jgi:flagellar basal body-associated protein FliL